MNYIVLIYFNYELHNDSYPLRITNWYMMIKCFEVHLCHLCNLAQFFLYSKLTLNKKNTSWCGTIYNKCKIN